MLNQRGKPWSPERFVTRPTPPLFCTISLAYKTDSICLMERTSQVSQADLELCTQQRIDSWSVCFHLPIQLLGLQMWATIPAWTTSSWVWRSHLIVIIFSWARLQSDESYHDTPVSVAPLPSLHTPCPLPVSLSLLPLLPQVLLCYHTYRLPSLCQSYLCPSRPKSAVFDTQPYASTSSVACEFSPSR